MPRAGRRLRAASGNTLIGCHALVVAEVLEIGRRGGFAHRVRAIKPPAKVHQLATLAAKRAKGGVLLPLDGHDLPTDWAFVRLQSSPSLARETELSVVDVRLSIDSRACALGGESLAGAPDRGVDRERRTLGTQGSPLPCASLDEALATLLERAIIGWKRRKLLIKGKVIY